MPLNGVVSVGDITFDAPQPIPVSLTLGSLGGPLAAAGQTLQLAATATYADGSRRTAFARAP